MLSLTVIIIVYISHCVLFYGQKKQSLDLETASIPLCFHFQINNVCTFCCGTGLHPSGF